MTIERTLVIIKPNLVERNEDPNDPAFSFHSERTIIGQIKARFNNKGYNIIRQRSIYLSVNKIEQLYPHLVGKDYFPRIGRYMTRKYVIVMIVEGEDAIDQTRTLIGPTNPKQGSARQIRFDFCTTMEENGIHSSDSQESYERELNIFPELEGV